MCISPISAETLVNLKKYKYVSRNDSIIYNNCMSPLLNKLVNCLPRTLSPNLIILFSLCFNIITGIIVFNDTGFDLSKSLKRRTCFIIGFFQLFYSLLNNINEKQLKRTNSTTFEIIINHWYNIFTTIFTAFNLSKLLLVGNDNFISFSVFLGLFIGFYMATYENYKIGEIYFPGINSADEGNFAIFILGIVNGIIGQGWLSVILNWKWNISVGQFIGITISIGGFLSIFILYFHTYNKKGIQEMFINFLDNMNFYAVVIIPIMYIIYINEFYRNYKWIILINSCLIFARVTFDIEIKIATMDELKCNLMFIFSNFLFIISLFITDDESKLYFLEGLAIFEFSELLCFIYIRTKEITEYLEINIIC